MTGAADTPWPRASSVTARSRNLDQLHLRRTDETSTVTVAPSTWPHPDDHATEISRATPGVAAKEKMKMKKKLTLKSNTIRVLVRHLVAVRGGVPASEADSCIPSGIHTCNVRCVPF